MAEADHPEPTAQNIRQMSEMLKVQELDLLGAGFITERQNYNTEHAINYVYCR